MHDSHEKGTNVTPIEHSQKTPRSQTGFLAMLRAHLWRRGSSGHLGRSAALAQASAHPVPSLFSRLPRCLSLYSSDGAAHRRHRTRKLSSQAV